MTSGSGEREGVPRDAAAGIPTSRSAGAFTNVLLRACLTTLITSYVLARCEIVHDEYMSCCECVGARKRMKWRNA